MRGVTSHPGHHHISSSQSQSRPSGPAHQNPHSHPHTRPHMHTLHQPPLHQPPLHQPQQMINIQPLPARNDLQSVVQPPLQHQVVAAATGGSSPGILPNLLSWHMSQSFNTYPWRMQPNGVPFFTFPSTPPSYIPANSYPYTFAPLPAAPFSISPMQPVPSTVHVPSYSGLSVMVPQVTTVDTGAVPINANQSSVVTQGYAVAAPNAAGPSQPVVDREMQAVAVHVLQPHTAPPHHDHQLHQYQNIPQPPGLSVTPAAPPPALIATEHLPPPPPPPPQPAPPLPTQQPNNSNAPFAYEVITSQPLRGSTEHMPTAVNSHSQSFQPRRVQPIGSGLSPDLDEDVAESSSYTPLPVAALHDSGVMWADVPGPSGLNQVAPSESHSDSSRDSTPEISSFPAFSPDNDSDSSDAAHTPDISVSPSALFDEGNPLLSSDPEDSSSPTATLHDISTDSATNSALHTLADAAAILADSPSSADIAGSSASQSSAGQPLRLPVLINISDSDSESHLSPSPVIDLTHSPNTTTTLPTSHRTYNYGVIVSTPDDPASHGSNPTGSHATAHPPEPTPALHGDGRISAVFVPVIHRWNGAAEHQGLRPIQHYVPAGEQVGVVQAAQMAVDEVTHMVHPSVSSETSLVAPMQLQQPYPVQEYPARAPAAIAPWPAELPAAGHAVQGALLYPPQQPVNNPPHGDFWDTVIVSNHICTLLCLQVHVYMYTCIY